MSALVDSVLLNRLMWAVRSFVMEREVALRARSRGDFAFAREYAGMARESWAAVKRYRLQIEKGVAA